MTKSKSEIYAGNDWGDKLSFTVGSSYMSGILLGLFKGLYLGLPRSAKLPKKLAMNNFFNSLGKQTSRLANAFGSVSLIYYLMAGTLNLLLEDQLINFSYIKKNMLCGALTGVVYKSILGVVPACMGGILGAALVGSLTYSIDYLNNQGKIGFQMKF